MKWIGKGVLIGTISRKPYKYGEDVDPADISKDRLKELLEGKQLAEVTPEEIVAANQKKVEDNRKAAAAPKGAKEVVAAIEAAMTEKEVKALAKGDKRATIVKAASQRLDALKAAEKEAAEAAEKETAKTGTSGDDGTEGNEPAAAGDAGEGEPAAPGDETGGAGPKKEE